MHKILFPSHSLPFSFLFDFADVTYLALSFLFPLARNFYQNTSESSPFAYIFPPLVHTILYFTPTLTLRSRPRNQTVLDFIVI
jgi:hypothetical protein